jgi:hypothetical protein
VERRRTPIQHALALARAVTFCLPRQTYSNLLTDSRP